MNIGSKSGYPAGALSNFSPHKFIFDGVNCASMEGFLQALKHKDFGTQIFVCSLVGFAAKKKGRRKNWQRNQVLFWKGIEYPRDSIAYQQLLDRAYSALGENAKFRKALLASGNSIFTHSIGKRKQADTVLTIQEFCSRLTHLRNKFNSQTKGQTS